MSRSVLWVSLALASIVPVLLATYPPSLDYYQWMFEGELVARAIDGTGIPDIYEVRSIPVPNLASSAALGLLNLFLPADIAGRVFLAALILGFGFAFAFLVRSVQGKPTAIEFLGLPWAFGYFMYMGFLSYLVSIALAMVGLGLLHRLTRNRAVVGYGQAAILAAFGVLLFLAHAFGWVVFTLALGTYALNAFRRDGANAGGRIMLCALPSLVLLVWYGASAGDPSETRIYETWASKLQSLVHPLLLFLRIDPFPSVAPVFWVNALFLLLIIGLIGVNLGRSTNLSSCRSLRLTAAILMLVAVVLPFSWFAGLLRPDERLVLPAILILIATLPAKDYSFSRGLVTAGLAIGIIVVHAYEYRHASGYLDTAHRETLEHVSAGQRLLWLSVHTGDLTQNACESEPGPYSMGIPVLQHFILQHIANSRGASTDIFGTGIIGVRDSTSLDTDVKIDVRTPAMLHEDVDYVSRIEDECDAVIVVGCPEHIVVAEDSFSARYTRASGGTGFLIMVRGDG